jgi:hypothetical protein
MVNFRNIILAYVVIGVVMYGGGAIAFSEIGATQVFVEEEDGELGANEETRTLLGQVDGAIQSALQTVGGSALIAVYQLITGVLGFFLWPITVLRGAGAPWDITMLFGVPPVAGFFGSFIAVLRGI